MPLQPAAGVDDRAVFFGEAGRRQAEHFGLDLRRIDVVELAVVLPEVGGLGVQRIDGHQELQLGQRSHYLVFIRERRHRVKALAEVAVDLALRHHLEVLQHVVAFVPLRQPVKAPAVVLLRLVAVEGLHHADEEFRVVAPVVHLARQQRLRRVGLQVGVEIGLFLRRQRHVARQALRQQAEIGQPLDVGVAAQLLTPPPAMPMLPSSSWIIAMVRMFCAPTEC